MLGGCLGPKKVIYPEDEEQRPVPAYVIRLGWHMGIAFRGTHLKDRLHNHHEFPKGRFLMLGWGDNRYYPSDERSILLFLRAALIPTGSVIHTVGFNEAPKNYFYDADIVRLQLSRKGMKKMASFIARQFKKGKQGNLIYAAEGHFPNSAFFKSRGLYFFPKTSNIWTARVLRKSGFPITPVYALTSGNVIYQTRKHGDIIQ